MSGGIRTHLLNAFNPFLARFEPLKSQIVYILYISGGIRTHDHEYKMHLYINIYRKSTLIFIAWYCTWKLSILQSKSLHFVSQLVFIQITGCDVPYSKWYSFYVIKKVYFWNVLIYISHFLHITCVKLLTFVCFYDWHQLGRRRDSNPEISYLGCQGVIQGAIILRLIKLNWLWLKIFSIFYVPL